MAQSTPGLDESLAAASHRLRLQRLVSYAGLSFRYAVIYFLVSLAIILLFPAVSAWGIGLLVLALAAFTGLMAVAWFLPVSRSRMARELDTRFGLSDHAITATEFEGAGREGWLKLQYEATTESLRNLDWSKSWPLRWPARSLLAGAVMGLLAFLLLVRSLTYMPAPVEVASVVDLSQDAAALEDLFKDWEKTAELTEDPDLKELLAELKPMRDQLPQMGERELLTALSKLENKLESMKASSEKNSLEASAGEMAAAFDGMEEMGAMAAALRRKDFEKARERAEMESVKLAQPDAAVPRGADSAATQKQMSQAGEKLEKSGQQSAAGALKEVQDGAGKKNAGEMSKGLAKLGQAFSREASRQQAQDRLGLQLAQIGAAKDSMGQGEGEGMGKGISLLPKLSEQKGKGEGAGSETDPNRTKDPTQLDAGRTAQNLTGQSGEGESEAETESSDQPGGEAPRADRAAQFAQYEKLSQQAIADENLPLAYREAIRKYFEAIKPSNEK